MTSFLIASNGLGVCAAQPKAPVNRTQSTRFARKGGQPGADAMHEFAQRMDCGPPRDRFWVGELAFRWLGMVCACVLLAESAGSGRRSPYADARIGSAKVTHPVYPSRWAFGMRCPDPPFSGARSPCRSPSHGAIKRYNRAVDDGESE